MDINRNQFFMVGMVILVVGVQLRMVDSYELTLEATEFLAEQWPKEEEKKTEQKPEPEIIMTAAVLPPTEPQKKMIEPPDWLGWALVSIGSVLILHALALKKPD